MRLDGNYGWYENFGLQVLNIDLFRDPSLVCFRQARPLKVYDFDFWHRGEFVVLPALPMLRWSAEQTRDLILIRFTDWTDKER